MHLKNAKIYDFMFAGGKGKKVLNRILAEIKMKRLNKQQREAVHASANIVYVDAGPGAGKSTVIVARVKYLISIGIVPKEILVLAFNVKVVDELKEKLKIT